MRCVDEAVEAILDFGSEMRVWETIGFCEIQSRNSETSGRRTWQVHVILDEFL